jgi:hypothetical protein
VLSGENLLGVTPLYYQGRERLFGELSVRKEGFQSAVLNLDAINEGRGSVNLVPIVSGAAFGNDNGANSPFLRKGSKDLAKIAAGSTMVLSGVFAAYFKGKANRTFDSYLTTSNPGDLNLTRYYDSMSAYSLVISEVSFAVLAYLLLSD